jgi:hypothetical protein
MGSVEFHSFRMASPSSESLYEDVLSDALMLKELLEKEDVKQAIESVHIFGASSHRIQEAISPILASLGFTSEKKGLFSEIKVPGIRPDFYKSIPGGGILVEVERGKTIANNMDLLDVWKTHICQSANHLFLLVPQVRVTKTGGRQKIYSTVLNRVGSFFAETTAPIDVESVHVFGY